MTINPRGEPSHSDGLADVFVNADSAAEADQGAELAELRRRLQQAEQRLATLESEDDKTVVEYEPLPAQLQGLPEDVQKDLQQELQGEREENRLEQQLSARFGPKLEGLPDDMRRLLDVLPPEQSGIVEYDDNIRDELLDVGSRMGELGEEIQAIGAAQAGKEGAPTVIVGGRTQIDYILYPFTTQGINYFDHPDPGNPAYGTDPENNFFFRRIRLRVEGYITDRMIYKAVVDFAHPSEPQIKDMTIGWYLPGNRTLLLGHKKVPFGLDSLNSNKSILFMERPLVVRAFNLGQRLFGVRMQGYRDDLTMAWQYGLFSMEEIDKTGKIEGDSFQPILYGRLAAFPWYDESSEGRGYLHLGIAASIAKPDGDAGTTNTDINGARFSALPDGKTDNPWTNTRGIAGANLMEQGGLEAVFNVGPLHLSGEYMGTWVQRDETTIGTGPNVFFHGGYISLAYFLTPGDYQPWDRKMGVMSRVHPRENFFLIDRALGKETDIAAGWGAWQIKMRYGYVDLSNMDILGGVQDQLLFGLNWYWNAHSRLMVDIARGFINNHRPIGGFTQGDYWTMGTRFMVDF